jgi:hypothetical protein
VLAPRPCAACAQSRGLDACASARVSVALEEVAAPAQEDTHSVDYRRAVGPTSTSKTLQSGQRSSVMADLFSACNMQVMQ